MSLKIGCHREAPRTQNGPEGVAGKATTKRGWTVGGQAGQRMSDAGKAVHRIGNHRSGPTTAAKPRSARGRPGHLPPDFLAKATKHVETSVRIEEFAARHNLTKSESLALYLLSSEEYMTSTFLSEGTPEADKFHMVVSRTAFMAMGKILPSSPDNRKLDQVPDYKLIFHDGR